MSSEPAAAAALNLAGVSLSDRLRIAASKGQADKVQELISASAGVEPDHDGRTALHYAALNGYPAVCKLLIAAGCHTDTQDSLGYTALHRGAAQGHLDVIQVLLLNGCAINKQDQVHGNAALHEAAWNGYSKTLELLVKSSCDVFITNRAGFTALHLAAQNGHNESSRVLLYSGIDPDMKNNYGDTALHTAARYGHAGVTRILISARCKLNEQNKNGDTALHIAAALRRRKIAKLFMEAGVDITVKNKQGETSVAVAKRKEHPEVILIITGHKHAKSRHHSHHHHDKHKLDLISPLEGPEIVPDSQMPLKEPASAQQQQQPDSKKDKEKRLFFFRKKKTKEKEKPSPTVPPDRPPHPLTHKPYHAVQEAGHTHTVGGRVQGRRDDTKKGFFSQYVSKNGNQYYRDLAGNIKQGPIGYTPVCQCAPLIHKLEQRMEADRDNLYDHVDASHQVLKDQIDQLDRRTTQQVYALDKLTRERMDAERNACDDRVNRRLQQERADTERRLNIFGSTVRCNVQAWVESRFGDLDETIPHPVSHDDSGLYSHNMCKDTHITETGGRLYRTRSDETLSQSDCSFRHKKKRFYESRQLAMQQIRAWQVPGYNRDSRGDLNKFDHSTPMPNASKPTVPCYSSKTNTHVRFHDRYADGASPSHEGSPERAHHPSSYRPVGVRSDIAHRPFTLASPSSSSSHPMSSSSQHATSIHSQGISSSSHQSSVQSRGAIPKRQSMSVGDGQSYTRLEPSPVARLGPSPITRQGPGPVTHMSSAHSSPSCKPPPVPAKPPHHSTYTSSATAMWNNSILRQPQQSNLNARGPTGLHGPDHSLIAPVSGPYNLINSSHRDSNQQETDANDNDKSIQQPSRYQERPSVVHSDSKPQTARPLSLHNAPEISTNTTDSKPSDIFRRIPYPYQQRVGSTAYSLDRARTPDRVTSPIGRGQSPVTTPEKNPSVSPGGRFFNALSPSAQHYPFSAGYSSATHGQLTGNEKQISANVYQACNISHSPLTMNNSPTVSSAARPETSSSLEPVYRSAGASYQACATLPTGKPAVSTWSDVQPIGKITMSCSEPSLLKGKGSNNSNLIKPNTKPPVAAPAGSLSYANRGLSNTQQDASHNYENAPVVLHSKEDSGSNRSNPDSGFWDRGYLSNMANSRSACTRTPTSDLSTGTQSSSFSTDYNLSSTHSSIPSMQSSTPVMTSTPPVSETNRQEGTAIKPPVCTPNGPAKITSHIQAWYQKQSQENGPSSVSGKACEAVSGKTIGSVEIHQFNNNQHERNIPVRTTGDQRSQEPNMPIKTTIDPFTLMRSSDV